MKQGVLNATRFGKVILKLLLSVLIAMVLLLCACSILWLIFLGAKFFVNNFGQAGGMFYFFTLLITPIVYTCLDRR